MDQSIRRHSLDCAYAIISMLVFLLTACNHPIPRLGVGGRYEEGRDQFFRGPGGDMDKAVAALEYVVSRDPTYKDSLTWLGRAYYRKGRYQDAHAILQRALAVNKDDEMAWVAMGLTELRLGQNDKGIETLKGGITLYSRVMTDTYHNYQYWDSRGVVRAAIRRSAFLLTKGTEEKESILQATDRFLALVDDEENYQKNTRRVNNRPLYGGSP
jgi:tetratricopeptide (TPR) repeat protein